MRSSGSHLYRAVSEETHTHVTTPTLGPAIRFPLGLTGIFWMVKQRGGRNQWQTSLVFGGGRRSFTLVHMWRRIPERRPVKCERTLLSSILQIAESIIRALTHTDGGLPTFLLELHFYDGVILEINPYLSALCNLAHCSYCITVTGCKINQNIY